MTNKFNLAPLINYFSDKDPKIASTIAKFAEEKTATTKTHDSAFLDKELRSQVDAFLMNKKSTPEDLSKTKGLIAQFLETSDAFSDAEAAKQLKILDRCRNPRELGLWFYGMIQTAAGDKAIRSSTSQDFVKIAQTLVEIADELEVSNPELAQEADDLLATITAQVLEVAPAGMPPSGGDGNGMPPLIVDDGEEDELSLDEELPTEEFDEIPVDDFRSMAEGLPLRLTDRARKERWMAAHEEAATGLKYMQKGREKIERAHKMLDEAGDRIRFKTDFKW